MRRTKHKIQYGTTDIDFSLLLSERRTLGISVHPDLSVEVKAPLQAPLEKIYERVENRGRWIERQKEYFQQFLPKSPQEEYVSGETFLYIGKQIRLKVIHSKKRSIELAGRTIRINTPNTESKESIKRLLEQWYRVRAEEIFLWRLEQNITLFKKYSISLSSIKIRKMKNRWGSCSRDGVVTLNIELIKAPLKCIDYVIIHELCHLVHHHHGKEFYTLLNKAMPGWRRWKHKLETIF